tara:strand:+ start:3490 stop:3786 length:297 start_codon:yes stop_codon:yes gene_type:complete
MIDTRRPRARKVHQCDCCRRLIRKGQRYEIQISKDGGDFNTWKGCKNCVTHVSMLYANNGDDACFSDQYDGAREDCRDLGWRVYLVQFRKVRSKIFDD